MEFPRCRCETDDGRGNERLKRVVRQKPEDEPE
jgi:hypothetical protein